MRALVAALLAGACVFPAWAQPAGIAGLQQRASSSPLHFDSFDYPNGTTINGLLTPDGNSTWGANANAVVQNGELTNVGNTYPGFDCKTSLVGAAVPCKFVWGTFKYKANSPFVATVLIAAQDATMQKFLHLELGQDHYTFGVADAPNYPFNTVLRSDTYPVLKPGIEYRAAMEIDAVACTVKITLPDESIVPITHPSVCSINPKHVNYQVGAYAANGVGAWTAVGVGALKAPTFVAAGGGASKAQVNEIFRATQKISGQKTGLAFGTAVKVASFTNTGAQTVNRVRVNSVLTNGSMNNYHSPATAVAVDDREIVLHSNGANTQIGSVKDLNSTKVETQGVCVKSTMSYTLSGSAGYPYTLDVFLRPDANSACANPSNNGQLAGARLDYTVEVDGDPNGSLTLQ